METGRGLRRSLARSGALLPAIGFYLVFGSWPSEVPTHERAHDDPSVHSLQCKNGLTVALGLKLKSLELL